jgi:hypothetical protein
VIEVSMAFHEETGRRLGHKQVCKIGPIDRMATWVDLVSLIMLGVALVVLVEEEQTAEGETMSLQAFQMIAKRIRCQHWRIMS